MPKAKSPRKTKPKTEKKPVHKFRDKLILNQWLISLFGLDPLHPYKDNQTPIRPFHRLTEPLKLAAEGLDPDNVHYFYHALTNSNLFWNDFTQISKEQLLSYDENIVRHTQQINQERSEPIAWKYFQWLSLIFVEIYLERFFNSRDRLCGELNDYVEKFNQHYNQHELFPLYLPDDLNKLCLQNATGSGKTLLMHVNLLQYLYYLEKTNRLQNFDQIILLTPSESLSDQHRLAFAESGIYADYGSLFKYKGLAFNILEITKLGEKEGDKTKATNSFGDRNLLLVDEGHRGMSGKEEGAFIKRRNQLSANGFTFEYSATFEQAIAASGIREIENSYAKTILFDYAYRWFYGDGFGKDYQILNLPASSEIVSQPKTLYLTACLLKFYQQLRIYQENRHTLTAFNPEKPLWVFVGNSVSSPKGKTDEKIVATDIAQIIQFIADFLTNIQQTKRQIQEILTGTGQDTGLLDQTGNDIFAEAFTYLATLLNQGETIETLYQDILFRLFNHGSGGQLVLKRIKGESGEIALSVGTSETPFGLINVGDAKGLCDHLVSVATQDETRLSVEDSDFSEALFAAVKDSRSPVNLLIGSKKFVEGWDCWRVSTMGLMHVGKSEGSQIIQLFGRGVRLKGYEKKLKRCTSLNGINSPQWLSELETLNIFGIEADFMEKFRDFLKEEGLPGNEQKTVISIPLTFNDGLDKNLKMIRAKRKGKDGNEYNFKTDAPIPSLWENPPAYLLSNPLELDWYPRIQTVQSHQQTNTTREKSTASLTPEHLALLDYDALYFELERFKRERSWHNFNISKGAIEKILQRSDWYNLYLPENRHALDSFENLFLWQQITTALLKRYIDRLYNYRKREYFEPRLELKPLTLEDDNIPKDEFYSIKIDSHEAQLIAGIQAIKTLVKANNLTISTSGDLAACHLAQHLFSPLLHIRTNGKMAIAPVSLNQSEYKFVTDLRAWCEDNSDKLQSQETELYLLRNLSKGKGIGFFEAGNFHPDFILWFIQKEKQSINFIEPHGLMNEGSGSEKIKFHQQIKVIERRLNDSDITLNSYILSWTPYPKLKWDNTQEELEKRNVFFMTNDSDYLNKLMNSIQSLP